MLKDSSCNKSKLVSGKNKPKGWNHSVKIDSKQEHAAEVAMEIMTPKENSPTPRKKTSSERNCSRRLRRAGFPVSKKLSETNGNPARMKPAKEATSNTNFNSANFDPLVALPPLNNDTMQPFKDLHKKLTKSIKRHQASLLKSRKLAGGDDKMSFETVTAVETVPCQLGTKLVINETQGRRNTALLRIWTDSGPFSRVDAMTLASTVLETKLTEDFLYSGMSNEKQDSFSTFVEDLNKLLNISGSKFNSIGQIHYLYIWHLYGIYTSSMLNEKCVETIFFRDEDSVLESEVSSQCLLAEESRRISRNSRVSKDMDGVYAYFNLTTDNATQMLTTMNPALSECLSDPLQSFLVVYWRFVELGNNAKCKYLIANALNPHIKNLQKQFSCPKASNKYITVKTNNFADRDSSICGSSTNISAVSSVYPDVKNTKTAKKPKSNKWCGDKCEKVTGEFPIVSSVKKAPNKTICLEGCRYDVVRRIALETGFKEVTENDIWNIIWTDIPLSLDRGLEMRRLQDSNYGFVNGAPPLQKANHFPGMNEICRKDRLARNLNRMKNIFGDAYEFFPKTWCLPADLPQLMAYSRSLSKPATYICKPDSGAQGKGIFLVRNLKKLNPFVRLICQLYIPRPLLIDGYKFDLRIYTLITCCDPLRVYIYKEGLARFATVKYNPPDDENIGVAFMHLTNYSLNKFSQSYNPDGEGSKRKMSNVFNYLLDEGYDVQTLVDSIDSVVIKTMIAAQPTLRQYYRASFPKSERPSACFEILGFDILIDTNLQASLLEVNHSPSFNLDLAVDAEVKEALLRDTFAIIHLGNEINRQPTSKKFEPCVILGQRLSKSAKNQFEYESYHQGNYRLIYPTENFPRYTRFFDQTKLQPAQESPSAVFARKKADLQLMSAAALNAIRQYQVSQQRDIDLVQSTTSFCTNVLKKTVSPSKRPINATQRTFYTRDAIKNIVQRYTSKPQSPVSVDEQYI